MYSHTAIYAHQFVYTDTQPYSQIDRQIDRQADRQTDRHTQAHCNNTTKSLITQIKLYSAYQFFYSAYQIVDGAYQIVDGAYQTVYNAYQIVDGAYQTVYNAYQIVDGAYQIVYSVYQIVWCVSNSMVCVKLYIVNQIVYTLYYLCVSNCTHTRCVSNCSHAIHFMCVSNRIHTIQFVCIQGCLHRQYKLNQLSTTMSQMVSTTTTICSVRAQGKKKSICLMCIKAAICIESCLQKQHTLPHTKQTVCKGQARYIVAATSTREFVSRKST